MAAHKFRLFAYGTLRIGEPDHELLAGSELAGVVSTRAGYSLIELGPLAGMIESGNSCVVGELWLVEYPTLAACDKKRDHPRLYKRMQIVLADGSSAEAYLLDPDQVRGRRRLRGGDWKKRFEAKPPEPGSFVRWARRRHER